MKNNILIHTLFYQNYNYGGILQAYALYSKLVSMGYNCTELNYSQSMANSLKKVYYRSARVLEIMKHPISYRISKLKTMEQNNRRAQYIFEFDDVMKHVFDSFMAAEFQSTKVYYPDTIKELPPYDYYIAGGDQVWNPDWTDANFFFGNIRQGQKIGYSCSAGKSNFTHADIRKICHYLRRGRMNAVSVREKNFSDILNGGGV